MHCPSPVHVLIKVIPAAHLQKWMEAFEAGSGVTTGSVVELAGQLKHLVLSLVCTCGQEPNLYLPLEHVRQVVQPIVDFGEKRPGLHAKHVVAPVPAKVLVALPGSQSVHPAVALGGVSRLQ